MERVTIRKPKEYITDYIIKNIMSGSLRDDAELRQEDIARKASLSRMPVREALQELINIGIARRLPNRHVVVVGPTKRAIFSTFHTLSSMEAEFVRQILGNKVDLTSWIKKTNQFIAEPSFENELSVHTELSGALGVYPIIDAHRRLLEGYFSYAVKYCMPIKDVSVSSIKKLLQAVESDDLATASAALEEYFEMAAKTLTECGNYE